MNKNLRSKELDLMDIIIILLKNKKTIILITLVTTLISFLLFGFQKPILETYKVKAEFLPIHSIDQNEYLYFNNYILNFNNKNTFTGIESDNRNSRLSDSKLDFLFNENHNTKFSFEKIHPNVLLKKVYAVMVNNSLDKEKFDINKKYVSGKSSEEEKILLETTLSVEDLELWNSTLFSMKKNLDNIVKEILIEDFKKAVINFEVDMNEKINEIQMIINSLKDKQKLSNDIFFTEELNNLIFLEQYLQIKKKTEIQNLNRIIQTTPLYSQEFNSMRVNNLKNEYEKVNTDENYSKKQIFFSAFIFGLTFSSFFVLFRSSLIRRKNFRL